MPKIQCIAPTKRKSI